MSKNKKSKSSQARTSDGGSVSIIDNGNGGFHLTIERGFRETPEERLLRIERSRRGGFHEKVESRSAAKRDLRKEWF